MSFISVINRIKIKCKAILCFFYKSENLLIILDNILLEIVSIIYKIKPYLKRTSKIFGIGLAKTGTTSLASALVELGYKTKDYPHLPSLYKEINNHEAITDIAIMANFKKLDRRYPNSKFILTVRDLNSWLISYKNNLDLLFSTKKFKKWQNEIMIKSYGVVEFDKEIFTRFYNKYNHDVKEYFKNRPNNLIILNIVGGEGYEKLCPFLCKKILKKSFPHKNIGIH